jgi:hypothetical protein
LALGEAQGEHIAEGLVHDRGICHAVAELAGMVGELLESYRERGQLFLVTVSGAGFGGKPKLDFESRGLCF